MRKLPTQRKMRSREKVARGVVVESHRGIASHGRPRGAYGGNQLHAYRKSQRSKVRKEIRAGKL